MDDEEKDRYVRAFHFSGGLVAWVPLIVAFCTYAIEVFGLLRSEVGQFPMSADTHLLVQGTDDAPCRVQPCDDLAERSWQLGVAEPRHGQRWAAAGIITAPTFSAATPASAP